MTNIHMLLKSLETEENNFLDILDIEFSKGTFLVQIFDSTLEEVFWPFIQVTEERSLKDCFCSCDFEEEDKQYCSHIIKAIKTITDDRQTINEIFYHSLWFKITWIYMERLGANTNLLIKEHLGVYKHSSKSGKLLFIVKGMTEKGRDKLQRIIDEREVENEENSIKFSNISEEDLKLWKEGHPSSTLRYELSFWGDLGKQLMLQALCDQEYTLSFDYDKNGLPNYIHFTFTDFFVSFYLPQAVLPDIIPYLNSVNSPLKLYNIQESALNSISFDEVKQCFIMDPQKEAVTFSGKSNNHQIGPWRYLPKEGFYFQEENFASSEVGKDEISSFIEKHHLSLEQNLEAYEVVSEISHVHYRLAFDKQWNLHLRPYLFKEGDLQYNNSGCYSRWVFIEKKGFYKVEGLLFDNKEHIIPCEEVSQFVSNYRFWLNNQRGFNTRLTSIETKLRSRLTEEGNLLFESYADLDDDMIDCMDFGEWVYIVDHGFYAKLTVRFSWPVRSGVIVPHDEVSDFITKNKEDLEALDSFFCSDIPITKVGISIEFQESGALRIIPTYEVTKDFGTMSLIYFGRYVYLEGKGFCELPSEFHLPGKFSKEIEIAPKDISKFIKTDLSLLRKYTLHLDERLQYPKTIALVAEKVVRKETKTSSNLQMSLVLKTDLGRVNIVDLWKAQQSESEYILSPAGLINVNETRFQWLKHLHTRAVNADKEILKLSLLEFLKLNAFEEVLPSDGKGVIAQRHRATLEAIKEFSVAENPDLEGLKSTLRSYQTIGLAWLWFLYENHLSGLLCDDMGLGKTHQAMALLTAVHNRTKEKESKYLVVCPTSVIYHWEEKLKMFYPELRVYTYYGNQRDIKLFEKEYDLVLTSYGILRLEKKNLLSLFYEVAIFDEIQVAKNHQSQVHSVVSKVKGRLHLGLTGTPIENNLRELKSIFDLVLPSYMPSEVEYKTIFSQPIEKENSTEKKELLSRYIKPFVMRRKKSEVLEELPEKTEEVSHCSLTDTQAGLYQELLNSSRKSLLNDLGNSEKSIPYMHIFALLVRLKQVCNHPALFLGKYREYEEYSSGKWQLFVELLSQARESDQKVVVFSQFLGMLDIMETYLNSQNISFAMIKGSTQNRGKQLEKFSNDPNCKVFLGSLGAVGLGVDLTAASVVIHYDRWWNAAKENQATDRVHRIGQQRGVQVFKLVTKGTLEERIDELITRKGKLMEEVVGSDDHTLFKTFSRDDIIKLLQFVDPS
jgi:SNF2 family DNA or RNA helicase